MEEFPGFSDEKGGEEPLQAGRRGWGRAISPPAGDCAGQGLGGRLRTPFGWKWVLGGFLVHGNVGLRARGIERPQDRCSFLTG